MSHIRNQHRGLEPIGAADHTERVGGIHSSDRPGQMLIKTIEGDRQVFAASENVPEVGSRLSIDAFGDGNNYYVSAVIAEPCSTKSSQGFTILVKMDRRRHSRSSLANQIEPDRPR